MDLINIVGSTTRAAILKLLFLEQSKEVYLREIERISGLTIAPIQNEIRNLLKLGLIKSRKDGNRIYFKANNEHLLFTEIRGLVEKTSGVLELLRRAVVNEKIKVAFIFGSFGSGDQKHESDVDLFIIGDIGLRDIVKQVRSVSEKIGREINPHVMTEAEFIKKIKSKDHFITSITSTKKKFIVGNENELKGMDR